MNTLFKNIIYIIIPVMLLAGCIDPVEFPVEPEIEYVSNGSNNLMEFENTFLTISFQDGDGDLGFGPNTDRVCGSDICDYTTDTSCYLNEFWNAILIDMRDSCYSLFILPDVEPNGDVKGISGEIDILTPPVTCKQFDCPTCTTDTLVYQILIKDRAQHISNAILSDTIIIQCL